MDYTKIAEYELELEGLARVNGFRLTHEEAVAYRARTLELQDLIANERRKPTC